MPAKRQVRGRWRQGRACQDAVLAAAMLARWLLFKASWELRRQGYNQGQLKLWKELLWWGGSPNWPLQKGDDPASAGPRNKVKQLRDLLLSLPSRLAFSPSELTQSLFSGCPLHLILCFHHLIVIF